MLPDPRAEPVRALVFMTARNCERYVGAALASVARQTHPDLHVLFVDDSSTDATGQVARQQLETFFAGRHTYVRNESSWGKARNAHVHLREALPNGDFVAVVDGDDQLIEPTILAELARHYAAGSDVVWTNFVTDSGAVGCGAALDPLLPPRGQGWHTSHLFSFRGELLSNVPESYFQDARGDWFTAACDMALAFPVLDQTRRYTFLPVRAYRYTASNPNSHHRLDPNARGLNSTRQRACALEIHAKPALPCTRPAMRGGAPEEAVLRSIRDRITGDLHALERRLEDGLAWNAWRHVAAQQVAARCPQVIDMIAALEAAPLDPIEAWSLLGLMRSLQRPPRVLEIGAGRRAGPIAAIAHGLGGAFWSVTADADRAEALARAFRRSPELRSATVLTTERAEVDFRGVHGRFPDLGVLGDQSDFDVVAVSWDPTWTDGTRALVSLPVVTTRLARGGFAFLLLTDSVELQRGASEYWRLVAPELQYTVAGCAGHALVVTAGP